MVAVPDGLSLIRFSVALARPLLVFRDEGIEGGIFDNGVSDVFVQQMPDSSLRGKKRAALREVLQKLASEVRTQYYKAGVESTAESWCLAPLNPGLRTSITSLWLDFLADQLVFLPDAPYQLFDRP